MLSAEGASDLPCCCLAQNHLPIPPCHPPPNHSCPAPHPHPSLCAPPYTPAETPPSQLPQPPPHLYTADCVHAAENHWRSLDEPAHTINAIPAVSTTFTHMPATTTTRLKLVRLPIVLPAQALLHLLVLHFKPTVMLAWLCIFMDGCSHSRGRYRLQARWSIDKSVFASVLKSVLQFDPIYVAGVCRNPVRIAACKHTVGWSAYGIHGIPVGGTRLR